MQKIRLIDPEILPGSGIVQAAKLRALLDASDVIAGAEAWAEDQNLSHAKQLSAALSEAREEAYAEGLRDLLAGAAEYRAAAGKLEDQLIRLLRDCIARVFDDRLEVDVLKATITPVLRSVLIEDDVTIVVHPSRAKTLEDALRQASDVLTNAMIGIETDDRLSGEECRIYTASDVIDVSVPVVVDRLIGALANHMKSAPAVTGAPDAPHDGGQSDE